MKVPFTLGVVGHFGLAVRDPKESAKWGPEAPGSKNMGLWFRDPDGYRWELSVLGGK